MSRIAAITAALRIKLADLAPKQTWCCLRTPCRNHRPNCVWALSQVCADCHAEPGEACSWSCSSNWR